MTGRRRLESWIERRDAQLDRYDRHLATANDHYWRLFSLYQDVVRQRDKDVEVWKDIACRAMRGELTDTERSVLLDHEGTPR